MDGRLLSVVALVLILGLVTGCGSAPATGEQVRDERPSDRAGQDDSWTSYAPLDEEDGVEVPDATFGDGDDAWTAVEDAGLAPVFVDGADDPYFDGSRDGSGCDVLDQTPAAGDMAADGDEVEIAIDCTQVDWENQEGSTWEGFSDAYGSAFDDGCLALFDESPDGSLYEDDYEYTVLDCQNLNPGDATSVDDFPAEAPDDPESAAQELGETDGCEALFEEEGVTSLYWGEQSITEYDCPVGGYVAPLDAAKRKRPSGSAKPAGDTCAAEQADGTPMEIEVDRGKINCEGAAALWREYLRRAPTDGAGSSGALELEGWMCASATATSAPREGGCDRLDDSASFVVYAAG